MNKLMMIFLPGLLLYSITAQTQGNVGIGIVNPTLARLQVNGVSGSGSTSAIFGGDGTGISFQRSLPVIGFNHYQDNASGNGRYMANGFAATQTFDHTTGSMYFDLFPTGVAGAITPAGVRGITINNAGNIGIRTAPTNSASLYVAKQDNVYGAIFTGSSYPSYFLAGASENTVINAGRAGGKVLINENHTGNIILGGGSTLVGINTGTPLATLDIHQVAGKGLILVDPVHNFDNWEFHVGTYQDAPQSDLKLYSNETFVSIFSAVYGYYTPISSDLRIKSNIKPLPPVLTKLSRLQPKEYEMKDFNNNHEKTFGFIAQEVNQLYPEFVKLMHVKVDSANTIPELYTMDYGGFDALTIKALQEQYAQLKALEDKNRLLLKRLEALEMTAEKKISPRF